MQFLAATWYAVLMLQKTPGSSKTVYRHRLLMQCTTTTTTVYTTTTTDTTTTHEIADNKIADVDELKTRLIDEWAQFDQSIVDAAISQWRRRLSVCVRVHRSHFDHKFEQF